MQSVNIKPCGVAQLEVQPDPVIPCIPALKGTLLQGGLSAHNRLKARS